MACKVGTLTESLPAPDRLTLNAWLVHPFDASGRFVSAQTMAAALTAEGHDVGATTVKDHRGRRCSCYREG